MEDLPGLGRRRLRVGVRHQLDEVPEQRAGDADAGGDPIALVEAGQCQLDLPAEVPRDAVRRLGGPERARAGARSDRAPAVRSRSAWLSHLGRAIRQPARVSKRPTQEVLDLGVGASQLVTGPAGERVVDGGIEAQQDALAFAHRVAP